MLLPSPTDYSAGGGWGVGRENAEAPHFPVCMFAQGNLQQMTPILSPSGMWGWPAHNKLITPQRPHESCPRKVSMSYEHLCEGRCPSQEREIVAAELPWGS